MRQPGPVDWADVDFDGCPAVRVPGWVEGLRSPDPEVQAYTLQVLWSTVWSADKWFSAHPPFIVVLFDLAADATIQRRDRLINFATNILTRGAGTHAHRGLDFNEAAVRNLYEEGLGAQNNAVFVEHLTFLVGLLADPDCTVRAAAAEALAFVFEAPRTALAPLSAAIRREQDESVLGTMLHALGLLIRYSGERAYRAVLDEHADSGQSLLVRACATTGILACDSAAYDPSVFSLFVEAMDVPDPPRERLAFTPRDRFPSATSRLDAFLYGCVQVHGGASEAARLRRATLERGTVTGPTWNRLAESVIATEFKHAQYATRSEFTAGQLATLDLLSRRESAAPFHYLGVPATLSTRRRWLEFDPAGPLNWPVEVETQGGGRQTCPVWKALLLADESPEARPELLREHFAPLQILAIFEDIVFLEGETDFTEIDCGSEVFFEAAEQAGVAAIPWAVAVSERISKRPQVLTAFENLNLLPIVRALGEGELLDPRLDAAVCPHAASDETLALVREVLKRVPIPRREAIFLRFAEGVPRPAWFLTDTFELCPTAALTTCLLDAIDGKYGQTEDAPARVRSAIEAFTKAGRHHPEVAAALRAHVPQTEGLKSELKKALEELRR